MKLELKHLVGYLPYRLKVVDIFKERDYILEMTGLYSFGDIYTDDGDITIECIKPILRPLSDLTKEIEVNGEKFVPIGKIKESQHHLFFRCDLDNPIDGLQYSEVQKLLEWHFDIYGLIENGLAIDINTINNDN